MEGEKLLFLANFVRGLSKTSLDMENWTNECGTVRCLGGWACSIPEFNANGLTMAMHTPRYECDGKVWFGYQAIGQFFGLDWYEIEYLFSSYGYKRNPSVKTVTNRVRKFVETRKNRKRIDRVSN